MSLQPGTCVGPYEIAAQIGAGGMGEVYRATDSNLARQVAIKVLPESVAADPERLARFDREAKTLAALNHPNIAQIYGLERTGGAVALVMELVEGPTLAEVLAGRSEDRPLRTAEDRPLRTEDEGRRGRLSGRPGTGLPVDDALAIAKQIAEALEAAHEQGIIHRDLKPANIKVRPDGMVKVLDFGLAKAMDAGSARQDPAYGAGASQSPTITTPAMTQAGMILGTAAYMSPEQAKGRAVDKRVDVWAFGCVLYELLTGRRAFEGDDVSEVFAAVIKSEPDWKALPVLPPLVASFLKQCLHKDPRQRTPDIATMRLVMSGAFESAAGDARAQTEPTDTSPWRRRMPVAVTAGTLGVLVAGLVSWGLWPPAQLNEVNRFEYRVPDDQVLRRTGRALIALAPDGRQFVYNTAGGLYLRRMGELEARVIPGSEPDSVSPIFSPDGQSVAYWDVRGELRRIAVSGGAPVTIASIAQNPWGMSWGSDDTVLVGQPEGVVRVPIGGGAPEVIIPVDNDERVYGPQLLPDGDTVLLTITSGEWDEGRIVTHSLSSGTRTVLVEGGSDARFIPTGHLVYAFGDGLFGVSFDLGSLRVTSGPVPLVRGVARASANQTGVAQYGVSTDGTLTYVEGSAGVDRTLVWVDREGREEVINVPTRAYTYVQLSPDGTKLALDIRDDDYDIWIWDLARETLQRLTFDPGLNRGPTWTPDGRRIAFSRVIGETEEVYWQAADGSGVPEPLTEASGRGMAPSDFTPDGARLIYHPVVVGGEDIWIVPVGGETRVGAPLLETEANQRNATVSPDGRWVAYESDESGVTEVYVRPFPDVQGGRWQVSTAGGSRPRWRQDGRELFYYAGQGTFMAVPVELNPTFAPGTGVVAIQGDYVAPNTGRQSYDVSRDGRFLVIKQASLVFETKIIVVQHWTEELRRLVSTN